MKRKKPLRRPLTTRNYSSAPSKVYAGRFNSSFSKKVDTKSNYYSKPYPNPYSKTYNTNNQNSNTFDNRPKTTSSYAYSKENLYNSNDTKPKRDYNAFFNSNNLKKEYNTDRTSFGASKPNLNATIMSSNKVFDVRAIKGDNIPVINKVPDEKPTNERKYFDKEDQPVAAQLNDSSN